MATDTARLRALLEAHPLGHMTAQDGIGMEGIIHEVGSDGERFCGLSVHLENYDGTIQENCAKSKAKALAVTEAVNALPGLIAENERLRAALEQIRNRSDLDVVLGRNKPEQIAEEALNAKG